MDNKVQTDCEACLGSPTGQCFECYNFFIAELEETETKPTPYQVSD
ncbi:hypothetical protein FIV04_25825 (plasmid) [Vibrio sp. THAF190c]|nr:hypothetical protein FIV04_25825 [Vibrio sp. THAF190c]